MNIHYSEQRAIGAINRSQYGNFQMPNSPARRAGRRNFTQKAWGIRMEDGWLLPYAWQFKRDAAMKLNPDGSEKVVRIELKEPRR